MTDGCCARDAQSLLDEMGADRDCTTLNPEGDLVVARPEAVYFYSVDGRGPCFVFEGARLHRRTCQSRFSPRDMSLLQQGHPLTSQ